MLVISIISLVLTQEDDNVAKVRQKTQLDVAKLSDPTLTGDIIVALHYPNMNWCGPSSSMPSKELIGQQYSIPAWNPGEQRRALLLSLT